MHLGWQRYMYFTLVNYRCQAIYFLNGIYPRSDKDKSKSRRTSKRPCKLKSENIVERETSENQCKLKSCKEKVVEHENSGKGSKGETIICILIMGASIILLRCQGKKAFLPVWFMFLLQMAATLADAANRDLWSHQRRSVPNFSDFPIEILVAEWTTVKCRVVMLSYCRFRNFLCDCCQQSLGITIHGKIVCCSCLYFGRTANESK